MLLSCCLHSCDDFYFSFPLRCRQSYIVALFHGRCRRQDKLMLVSLLPAINYRQCRCYRQKINRRCHGIDENLRQGLITGVSDTGNNFSLVATTLADVVDTNKHKVANICENFCKNSQRPKWILGGPAGGNWFMKKTCTRKSRVILSLRKEKCFYFRETTLNWPV